MIIDDALSGAAVLAEIRRARHCRYPDGTNVYSQAEGEGMGLAAIWIEQNMVATAAVPVSDIRRVVYRWQQRRLDMAGDAAVYSEVISEVLELIDADAPPEPSDG